MSKTETQYIIHGEETSYRVRPNPDGGELDGSEGVVIEWIDAGESKWSGYFSIAPEAAVGVSDAIRLIMNGNAS